MTTIDKTPQWIEKPLVKATKPAPLEYTFTDSAGEAIEDPDDEFSATFQLRKPDGTTTETGAVWDNATATATFTLTTSHLNQSGFYFAQFFIDNGANDFAGDVLAWESTEQIYQPA